MVSLAEELLLLALDDEKGTIGGSVQEALKYGLAAAGVIDLMLAGRLVVGDKKRVSVAEASTTGDEILDEMLANVQGSKKEKSVGDWVKDFGNGRVKRLRERLESRLVERGVLRLEEGRYLRVFTWHHYPTVDGAPEAQTREKLRAVLLGDENPDARTATLISLVKACRLLDRLFPKEERKRAAQRAKQIADGEIAGDAVSKAVEEAAAAAAATTMAAISAATIVSASST
jgi:golgi phosphoprotein 3